MERKIKVIVAKIGLDAHDRGIKVVASGLQEKGIEVVYLGIYQTVDGIIKAAVAEDADVIGIGSSTGEYLTAIPKLVNGIKKANLHDVLLLLGGNIPTDEIPSLGKSGVDKIFPTDSNVGTMADYILQNVKRK